MSEELLIGSICEKRTNPFLLGTEFLPIKSAILKLDVLTKLGNSNNWLSELYK